jgi:hypothetical protein
LTPSKHAQKTEKEKQKTEKHPKPKTTIFGVAGL